MIRTLFHFRVLIKKMVNEIKYFKCGLKKKLKRPNCCRRLSLWDDRQWWGNITNINIDYIKENEFLVFLFQTKSDLCCVDDVNGQTLYNAIDKFFYGMFEFQTYFYIFITNSIYNNKIEIINDINNFKQFNSLPDRIQSYNRCKYIELFKDLVKKTNEWNYWKRLIIISYTKIILTEFSYQYAQINAPDFLQELINNIEEIFHKGLNN